jgi:signal transduction histidine kinase
MSIAGAEMNQEQRRDISELLSPHEISRLLKIAFTSIGTFRHSFIACNGAIFNGLEVIRDLYSPVLEGHILSEEDKKTIEFALELCSRSASRSAKLLWHLNTDYYMKTDPFRAEPASYVSQIQSISPAAEITLEDTGQAAVTLVYPGSALYVVIDELVHNAHRHRSKTELTPALVQISWRFREDRFACSIDDNGPGLSKDLTDEYRPLRLLVARWGAEKSEGIGIPTVLRAVVDSGGIVVARKSRKLGGTEVMFEIPIIGIWEQGEIIRTGFCYDD